MRARRLEPGAQLGWTPRLGVANFAALMPNKGPSDPAVISPARRWLFTAITILLPFLVLGAAEVLLRLFGWGGYPAWIREAGKLPSGESVCLVEPAAAEPYFFANPTSAGYPEQTAFLMPKPPGTLRVFLIGESAAKGYPQPRNLAMSSFLEAMLSDLSPGKKIEVINLGTVAVASFPLLYAVRDALKFSPDLLVFYTGNNEFFGAYGTASINSSASLPPWALRVMRAARGLALVQVLDKVLYRRAEVKRTLMEEMIGRTFIASDSPLRGDAARNLAANLGAMLDEAAAAGVPSVVCTTASNESELAPLGSDDDGGLDEAQRAAFSRLLAEGLAADAQGDNVRAAALLGEAVAIAPRHARSHFFLGRSLAKSGRTDEARGAFLAARDLDTMPWRPVAATEEAIRSTARERKTTLCDIAEIFRGQSADGATGWDLLDDHVHPSLAGQARAARAMAAACAPLLGIDPGAMDGLPADEAYADRLGRNFYDDYRVSHVLRTLFGIPFMREANPTAFERFAAAEQAAEEKMSPAVQAAVREWQSSKLHVGGSRPLAGMVARVLQDEGWTSEALPLYAVAAQQVRAYSSWRVEDVYLWLLCRQKVNGRLDDGDLASASEAIAQGEFLVRHRLTSGAPRPGRGHLALLVAGLHDLMGETKKSLPFLLSIRPGLTGEDRFLADQALVVAYLRMGQKVEAMAVVDEGVARGGQFAEAYRRLRAAAGS